MNKVIRWNTGNGNITLTYQGQGDGPITVQSDANDDAARSQTIVVETTAGSPVVTKNLTISQGACPVPIGTVLNYAYTGSYQEVELPAGQYKLQCWGAQGGSNAAASSYGITAKVGGKGGYSEGVLTLTSKTTVRIYVGGAGSSSAGGFNGGGSTTGSSSYSSAKEWGTSRMGGGGGATDIRLSDGALLSRMIVAGGGSGGAMCYKRETTSTTITKTINSSDYETSTLTYSTANKKIEYSGPNNSFIVDLDGYHGGTIQLNNTYGGNSTFYVFLTAYPYEGSTNIITSSFSTFTGSATVNIPSNATHIMAGYWNGAVYRYPESVVLSIVDTSITTYNDSHVGYIGGGTNGGGYNSSYYGKQNGAGTGGSFGQGANQTATNYRYCSGAGGGGWYGGGGGQHNDSSMTYCRYSGGGSGWVNIAANASYRPSGYTGLELDSGETKAGNTSFPNTAGTGNEKGHSGNGYVRITRLS